MPVSCEKRTVKGSACGVAATGRCTQCDDAFCASHQARGNLLTSYVDLCLVCQIERTSAAAEADAARRRESGESYVFSSAPVTELLSANVPTVELVAHAGHTWRTEGHAFRRRSVWVDHYEPCGTGWFIASFLWTYRGSDGPDWTGMAGTFLLSAPYDGIEVVFHRQIDSDHGFRRVKEHGSGYVTSGSGELVRKAENLRSLAAAIQSRVAG